MPRNRIDGFRGLLFKAVLPSSRFPLVAARPCESGQRLQISSLPAHTGRQSAPSSPPRPRQGVIAGKFKDQQSALWGFLPVTMTGRVSLTCPSSRAIWVHAGQRDATDRLFGDRHRTGHCRPHDPCGAVLM